MNISILITSKEHPVNTYVNKWVETNKSHQISIVHSKEDLASGDILFLISCSDIVSKLERDKFKKTLIIHASDLPNGRGWSPHIWEIINGATDITLSLLEAEDEVDTGDIWKKISVPIPKTTLFDEINELIFDSELALMDFAIENYNTIEPKKQSNIDSAYWPKRSPKDSLIDINKTLADQFDLIRVCDSKRFPAYFYKEGVKFNIVIEKNNE
ncbi:MAG TPA: UDP-glucuronic acid dehydrogenase [Candidatus Thioglobus autotrophicus]|jgi:methionyl-tRNA formyltransferase|nr:UDP-glucuronic acid dehydrogenase [Candidatus Thioglobus autotrophicus]